VRPDIAVSGDFIVGFPGETENEFLDTLSVVDTIGYAQAFSFKYSARPGTPAADLDGMVSVEVMDDRLQRLQARLSRDQARFNIASIGRRCELLLEREGRKPGQLIGKSPWMQSVHVLSEGTIGEIVTVDLVDAGPLSLTGTIAA
jgi:tRNA-2-methylthio-N6-dimethylallyladenosine synthase